MNNLCGSVPVNSALTFQHNPEDRAVSTLWKPGKAYVLALLDDLVPDGVQHNLSDGMDTKLEHDSCSMGFNGPD